MDTNVHCMGAPERAADDEDKRETSESRDVPAKRTRTIMTPEQNNLLMKFFLIDPFPSTEVRKNLAKSLGIRPRTVQIWFQNQRQKHARVSWRYWLMSRTRSTADSAAKRVFSSARTCSVSRRMASAVPHAMYSNKSRYFVCPGHHPVPNTANLLFYLKRQSPLSDGGAVRTSRALEGATGGGPPVWQEQSYTRTARRQGGVPLQHALSLSLCPGIWLLDGHSGGALQPAGLNFFLATPMSYSVSFAIPSRSPGLLLDSDIHFASSSFIFSSGSFVSVSEDILMLQRSSRYVVATERRIHVVSDRVVCSLNRAATALAVQGGLIAIGSRQSVEVWRLHTANANNEHIRPFFSLKRSFPGHSDSITSILFLDGVGIVSTSLDCTTRLHACDMRSLDAAVPGLVGGDSLAPGAGEACRRGAKVISRHKSAPLAAFDVDGCVAIVTRRGAVCYLDRDWNTVSKVYVEGDVVSAAKCGSIVAVLIRACGSKPSEGHADTLRLALVTKEGQREVVVDSDFFEIAANDSLIALKGNSISVYDPLSGTLTKLIDLVDVTAMCEHRDRLVVGCTDHRLRLYSPLVGMNAAGGADAHKGIAAKFSALRQWLDAATLHDENVREAPLNIHMADNLVLSLTLGGYVSVFNVSDTNCFRSFPLNLKVRTSAVSPDFSVLFVSGHKLHVVDLKRGRKVDEFDYQVLSVRCTRDRAYLLTLDAFIVYDYSDFTSYAMRLESGIVGDEVSVVTSNTVTMYDLGLNFVRTLSGSRVFCSNSRRIVVENRGVEVVELDSMESERLDVKDPRGVACSCTSRRVYVQTAHSVIVYDSRVPFADLDLDATIQSFDSALAGARFYEALVVAIKLGRMDLLRRVMCMSVFSVRSLSPRYVSAIKRTAIDMIENDTAAAMAWLRTCLFEHDGLELDDIEVHRVRTVLEKAMEEGRRNWKMLCKIRERAQSAADAAAP
ncbi:UNVERIFIED_CONTAM: hypothetical protein PYX00_011413 [Menopon gallinae]|uniref:Homeobox domain-containing protein n=1 Tax=Menopon gallinae TaxID=328185 RepID=A0AAW2H7L0_9NEOP